MQAVPKAEAPSVKTAKSLKKASQKLEIKCVVRVCKKNTQKAVLKFLILLKIRYKGIKAIKVKNGQPNKYNSFGIAADNIKAEKTEEKITCKINSIILLF